MKSALNTLMTVLLLAMPAAAAAAPVGYSVNSDAPDGDALHRIELATGVATPVSDLQVLSSTTGVRKDIEGLAFDSAGVLWAVDEDSFRLFQVNTLSGIVQSQGDVPISGLSDAYGNDFGMTFTCEDSLYISSVSKQTLYRLDLDGSASPVGAVGALWPLELAVMILPTGMLSVLSGTVDDGWSGQLGWFWVACAVTTIALVFVTRAALRERQYSAVMAATGLLYLAILTGFGMDLVARAVLAG